MRDIKFATVFPSYHPRKGESTHFVERMWTALISHPDIKVSLFSVVNVPVLSEIHKNFHANEFKPKTTTIRAGNRWKKGDMFVPKIWTGKPYRSKTIAICDPLQIKKVEKVWINIIGDWYIDDKGPLTLSDLEEIASCDGFDDTDDFELWFNLKRGKEFVGQRITFIGKY